jgi:molybdopterin-guanine dinucleotide biosynthesis protein A
VDTTEAVTVAILAGGLSSRMGSDKSFVQLGGKPLITHVIEGVSHLSTHVMIIANQPAAYAVFGLSVFTDVLPDRSSLAGLYSAVYHSPSDYTLCVACDMPFLNPALLNYMIGQRSCYDAVVPLVGGYPQGLHALYRKTCLVPMRQQLEENQFRVQDLYEQVNTRWVDEETARRYDCDLASFINVNTPGALKEAEVRIQG